MKKVIWGVVILTAVVGFILGVTGTGQRFLEGGSSRIDQGQFINDQYGLRFALPKESFCHVRSDEHLKLFCAKEQPVDQPISAESMKRGLPFIQFDFHGDAYIELDKLVDKSIEHYRATTSAFQVLSRSTKTVSGAERAEFAYTGDAMVGGSQVGQLYAKYVFVLRKNVLYTFWFMDLLDKYEDHIAEFDKLVSSISFH